MALPGTTAESGGKVLRVLATVCLAVVGFFGALGSASADGLSRFLAGLDEGGYTATVDQVAVQHAGFSAAGILITADKFGATARVELLSYGSQAELEQEWLVVDQGAPESKILTLDFAGRLLVWREESILVLNYDPPSDPGTVQIMAGIFFGRRGIDFHGLSPRIIPPGTGNGGLRAAAGD